VSLVYDGVVAFQWPRAAALAFVLLAVALAAAALIQALLRPQRVGGRGR
jgi:putative spermidine/putrescine transport system permease protein